MKKILFALASLFLPVAASAATMPGEPSTIASISSLYTKIATAMWEIFAALALIMFVIAGITFLTASGDPGKITKAKDAFIWGCVGVAAAVLAYSVVAVVKSILGV